MKTMQSKFSGICRDCNARVPRGATIVYHGRGSGISCQKCAGGTASPRTERHEPDRFDMDYEDRCAEACGL